VADELLARPPDIQQADVIASKPAGVITGGTGRYKHGEVRGTFG
jgi:hypothetical protein